jgi:hypothetical protein
MRATLNNDDHLLGTAAGLSGIAEKNALLREALKALIERQSARRLAHPGGTRKPLGRVVRRQPTLG